MTCDETRGLGGPDVRTLGGAACVLLVFASPPLTAQKHNDPPQIQKLGGRSFYSKLIDNNII